MLAAVADASKASGLCLAMLNACVSALFEGMIGSFRWDASVRVMVEFDISKLLRLLAESVPPKIAAPRPQCERAKPVGHASAAIGVSLE